jgi:hypothetical protein
MSGSYIRAAVPTQTFNGSQLVAAAIDHVDGDSAGVAGNNDSAVRQKQTLDRPETQQRKSITVIDYHVAVHDRALAETQSDEGMEIADLDDELLDSLLVI